jgi:hypothetical protein
MSNFRAIPRQPKSHSYFPKLNDEVSTIEYFRLNIEYLRYSFDFKKDGAKRHP